jgi:AcrR family transcriptional regulator
VGGDSAVPGMTTSVDERSEVTARIRSVTPPLALMPPEREEALTQRQRELLDELTQLFEHGWADLTMADLAARMNCSLRTLYELAPTRDELVLTVVDRNLWRIGQRATASVTAPDIAPLDAIQSYLRAATVAVAAVSPAFARDLAAMPAAQALEDAHNDYLVAVTRALLDLAVEQGSIGSVDTAAVARTMAGLGRDLSRPEVMATLGSSPKDAADGIVDVVLRGLRSNGQGNR